MGDKKLGSWAGRWNSRYDDISGRINTGDFSDFPFVRVPAYTRQQGQLCMLRNNVPPRMAKWAAWKLPLWAVRWYLEARGWSG